MKAIITWYDKADRLVEEAGAIQQDIAARILALPTREAQMDFVASKVAPAIAARPQYKAKVVRTKTGGVSFNKPDGTRHSTALSALRYWCARTTLFAPSGSAAKRNKTEKPTINKRVFLLNALKLLSASDRKWIINQLDV